jgi:DNA-binding transcriptional regulator WhiA
MNKYTESELINALTVAGEEFGPQVTLKEYRKLDLEPSSTVITRRLGDGSWLTARSKAGLDGTSQHHVEVNESYFSNIDSTEKSYWLGFFLGDGWVNGNTVGIILKKEDKNHVKKFHSEINSKHKISERGDGGVGFQFRSDKTSSDLNQLGVGAEKTNSKNIPSIKNNLVSDFYRGWFDADGSYHNQSNRVRLTSASYERLEKAQNQIPCKSTLRNNNGATVLDVTSLNEIKKLVSWMYPSGTNTTPTLDRKRNQACEYC